MRALALILLIGPNLATAQIQAWEKLVAPGLTYRMEMDLSQPLVIHAIRYSPGALTMTSRPELAKAVVFVPSDETKGRDTLSRTITASGAVGGINADFFPWNGDPLGLMIRAGELVSKPFAGRAAFAWGPGYMESGPVKFEGSVAIASGDQLTIHGINEECGDNMLVLNTPAAGTALSRQPAVHAVIDTKDILKPNGTVKGTIRIFEPDATARPIAMGEMVLTATGNMVPKLMKAARDSEVVISTKLNGFDWSKTINAVGGGPALVKNGAAVRTFTAEGFQADFIDKRHPRTAIGATKEGDIWLVVADGRQAMSRGATLPEMAKIMVGLGCRTAINLDGGGSSTLNLMGVTLNRPSDGTERAISNSILLFSAATPVQAPATDPVPMVIAGMPRIQVGRPQAYRIVTAQGETVPDGEVLWAAMGNAWIDQSGTLRGLKAGTASLSAFVRGQIVRVEVTVEDAPPANVPPRKQ